MLFYTLLCVVSSLSCINSMVLKGGRHYKRYLYCPESVHYATLERSGSPRYYELSGIHPNNPSDTEYIWTITEIIGCKENEILTDGWDESIFKILKPEEYCEMEISLNLEATFNHKTRTTECHLTVIFQQPPYFGIDLGTTFSCIAYQSKETDYKTNTRKTEIVLVDKSNRRQYCIPTAIYFPLDTDTILFGQDAMDKLLDDPQNVLYDIKRIIGRKYLDTEVTLFQQKHLFKVINDENGKIRLEIPNRNNMTISAEQMLASIIIHLVSIATKQVNIPYTDDINVVISVPAFFHNAQRRAIKSVAEIARLKLQILVVEPTAAALAHAYYSSVPTDDMKLFMVFDFGGGTLDCSVMRCYGLMCDILAVSGNSTLGGIDFDHVVEDIIINKLINEHGVDPNTINYGRLLKNVEKLKKGLSANDQHEFKYNDELPEVIITQKEFEEHPKTMELLEAAIEVAHQALNADNAKFLSTNVRMILMVGGTSNIPIVSKTLKAAFENEFSLGERKKILQNLKNTDIENEEDGEDQYIQKINHRKHALRIEFPQIDPQLMVITGSAVLSGSLAYDRNSAAAEVLADDSFTVATTGIKVNDVIPLSLGFEVCKRMKDDNIDNNNTLQCGFMSVMVPKNSRYPIKVNKTYCQNDPNISTVTMMLYEGESEYVSDNHYLSSLRLNNILPWNDSCNTYHIVFNIDSNGIATIHGVVHNKDGSDGEIYTMSLAVLSNDGSLSKCELAKQQNQISLWFDDNNNIEIKQLLQTPMNIKCLLKEYTQRNHVFLDSSGSMRTAFFSSYSWMDIGIKVLKQISGSLQKEPTRLTLFHNKKKQILNWDDINKWSIKRVINEWKLYGGGSTFMWKMILDDVIQNHDDENLRARITIITDGEDNGSPPPYDGLNGMNPMMMDFNKKYKLDVEFNIIVLSDTKWDVTRYRDLCIATGGLFQKITDNSQIQMNFFKNEFLQKYIENNHVIIEKRRAQQKKLYEKNVKNHVIEPFDWYN